MEHSSVHFSPRMINQFENSLLFKDFTSFDRKVINLSQLLSPFERIDHTMIKKHLIFGLVLSLSFSVLADSCDEALRLMENPLNVKRKRELAVIAVKHCSAVKNPKPLLSLAKMDLAESKFSESIAWNEEAQKLNPNLVETYINICDIHNQMKAYEKTLSLCRKALSLKGGVSEADRAILQSQLGVAAFLRGEETSNNNLIKAAENYFLESLKYDPQKGHNYFYLGKIETDHYDNHEEGTKFFKKGCDLKDQPCCEKLKELASDQIKETPTAAPAVAQPAPKALPTPAPTPAAPLEPKKTDFGVLPKGDVESLKRISGLYIKKGLSEENAQKLEAGLAEQLKAMKPEDRKKMLEEFAKALTK